jgi:hypothetical protein
VQWAMWLLMLVLVLAGLAGAFGRGALSSRTVNSLHQIIAVRYERLLRTKTPAKIELTVRESQSADDFRILISTELMQSIRAEQTSPLPVSMQTGAEGTLMSFSHVQAPFRLTLSQEPSHAGVLRGAITMPGNEGVAIHQWVYP